MSDSSPPERPPQMSPDGQWVWNGIEWQPVGTHRSVFPSWNSIQVAPAEPAAEPSQAVMTEPEPVMAYPVPVYAVADVAAPPLWQVKSTGRNKYFYAAAGIIVLLIAMVFLRSMAPFIVWPWSGGSDTSAKPSPSPPAVATRSDYAMADRLARTTLAPMVTSLNQSMALLRISCNGALTVGCQADLVDTDTKVKAMLVAMDHQRIPDCIAVPFAKLRTVLVNMDTALQASLKAYQALDPAALKQSLYQYSVAQVPIGPDERALDAAPNSCDTQVVGP
jgi:hypothetical protein